MILKPSAPVLVAAALLLGAAPGRAQLPTTLQTNLFPFPGYHVSPAYAASAGLGLADRWLGDEPFDNPAAARPTTLELSPLLLHVSRQDLRADNRNYDETAAYFDAAGGAFTMERGTLGLSLYGYQPVLREEDNSFETGSVLGPTGSVTSSSSSREFRGGVAVSFGRGSTRFGVAGEWTHRSDHYERDQVTGAPVPSTYVADFSGDGACGQAGVRMSLGEGVHSLVVGGAVRYMAALDLSGTESLGSVAGDTSYALMTQRQAGWEGGVSARYAVTDAFCVLGATGGRTAQSYSGWGVSSGRAFEWKLAGEYHDARDPWTVRFALGQEQQDDVPEPRSGVVALGLGLHLDTTQVDLGLIHRSFKRADEPASTEDRIVASLAQKF
jgi:hypothetical protein